MRKEKTTRKYDRLIKLVCPSLRSHNRAFSTNATSAYVRSRTCTRLVCMYYICVRVATTSTNEPVWVFLVILTLRDNTKKLSFFNNGPIKVQHTMNPIQQEQGSESTKNPQLDLAKPTARSNKTNCRVGQQ